MNMRERALASYGDVKVTTGVAGADSVQLIQMLFDGLIESLSTARGHMERGAISEHRLDIGGQRREFSVVRVPMPAPAGGAPRLLCCLWLDLTEARAREARLQSIAAMARHT